MKTLLALTLFVGLAARGGPDYGKMLGEAKFSLSEAVDKILKESGDGVVVKCEIEIEKEKTIFTADVAQKDKICEIGILVTDGKVADREIENEDASKLVAQFKVTARQAIDTSVKKFEGKAVFARLGLENGKPVITVKVWKESKLWAVTVNGVTGEVNGSKEVKFKPGLIGIQGDAAKDGVRITNLVKDMPAVKAGLAKDDVIVSVGGRKVASLEELAAELRKLGADAKVKIEFVRAEKKSEVTVTLVGRDDDDDDEDDEDGEDDDDMEDGEDD